MSNKTKKTLFTADPHWWHKNIIQYEDRPYKTIGEMNKDLIVRWNNKVDPDDDVFCMGDFAFATEQQIHEILDQLNGNIHLIWGNHDKTIKRSRELQKRFVWCRDYYVIEGKTPIVLFHYPILIWDRRHHGAIHLYGHTHSDKFNHHGLDIKIPNSYNVGMDVRNYEPVTLEEILNGPQ